MPPLQEQLSKVPKWAWIAGGGIAIGAAFLLSRSSGPSSSVSGSETSALTDALGQLQDALNSLGGNEASGPPAGSGGGGSVGSGLDPTINLDQGEASDPSSNVNLGPTYAATGPTTLNLENSRIIAGSAPYVTKSGILPSGVTPSQVATPTQSTIRRMAERAGLGSAETAFLVNRITPVERYQSGSPTPVVQATPVTKNVIQQLAERSGLGSAETAFLVNRQQPLTPTRSQVSSTLSSAANNAVAKATAVKVTPPKSGTSKVTTTKKSAALASRTPTYSPLAVTQKTPVKQTGQRARAV
jgi:hypothetical protein